MNCTICNKPVILSPSAVERAKKYGGKPVDYTRCFIAHSQCEIDARKQVTSELMERLSKCDSKYFTVE